MSAGSNINISMFLVFTETSSFMHYLFILLFGFWEGLLGGQHFKSVLSIPAQNALPFLTSFY